MRISEITLTDEEVGYVRKRAYALYWQRRGSRSSDPKFSHTAVWARKIKKELDRIKSEPNNEQNNGLIFVFAGSAHGSILQQIFNEHYREYAVTVISSADEVFERYDAGNRYSVFEEPASVVAPGLSNL